jgi:hypothetical protein
MALESYTLEESERIWIEEARNWVKGHFTEDEDEKYSTIEGKLRVVATILEQQWVEPSETWKLQSLGIAFGDALAQQLMLEWVTIDDEFGRAPAVNYPGTSVLAYPLTMISKRVERGDRVDVWDMFAVVAARIDEIAHSGRST